MHFYGHRQHCNCSAVLVRRHFVSSTGEDNFGDGIHLDLKPIISRLPGNGYRVCRYFRLGNGPVNIWGFPNWSSGQRGREIEGPRIDDTTRTHSWHWNPKRFKVLNSQRFRSHEINTWNVLIIVSVYFRFGFGFGLAHFWNVEMEMNFNWTNNNNNRQSCRSACGVAGLERSCILWMKNGVRIDFFVYYCSFV